MNKPDRYLQYSLPLSANRILYTGHSNDGSMAFLIVSLFTFIDGGGHLQYITVRPSITFFVIQFVGTALNSLVSGNIPTTHLFDFNSYKWPR